MNLHIHFAVEDFYNTRIIDKHSRTIIPYFVRFDRLIQTFSVRPSLGKRVHTLSLIVHHRLWYNLFAADLRLLKLLPELRTLSLSPPTFRSSIPHNHWTLTRLRLDFSRVTDHYNKRGDWLHDRVPLQIISKHLWLSKLRKVQLEKVLFTPNFDERRHLLQGGSSVDDPHFLKCCKQKSDCVVAFTWLDQA